MLPVTSMLDSAAVDLLVPLAEDSLFLWGFNTILGRVFVILALSCQQWHTELVLRGSSFLIDQFICLVF